MRTLAYMPLHYGLDYLEPVLKSIRDSVDDILICYTKHPSYGHEGSLKNPDSEEDLRAVCEGFNVIWQEVKASRENQHRQYAIDYAQSKGYDIALAVDSDEIWQPDTVKKALQAASNTGARFNCIAGSNWYHFWKNHKEVNRDGFYPMRIININERNNKQEIIKEGMIYHMGYAISEELMRYKLSCHGHKSEIPGNWFEDKWLNYKRGVTKYLHPASRDIWVETEDFNGTIPCLKK